MSLQRRFFTLVQTGVGSGIVFDCTREQRRVQKLWNYLAELESSLDALPEAFVLFDRDDRLLLANERYYKMYPSAQAMAHRGVRFSDIAERSVYDGEFILNEAPDAWLKRRIDFHRTGTGFFEQRLQTGQWIRLSERRTRSGGVVSVRVDITPLKERERTLRRSMRQAEFASRSMSRFLAVFSHEMRNGLNGILGTAQMLALDAEAQEQKERAHTLMESCNRLSTVMTDLLDYLKNEAGGVTITLREVDPSQLVQQVQAEFAAAARKRGLRLVCDAPADRLPMLELDADRVMQVLSNLVSNAIKYSERGLVRVGLGYRDGRLRCDVEDEGRGIDADRLSGLFEYFNSTSPHAPESTGLGLAISKQLVSAMGGALFVRSKPGQGSRFWFDIPCTASASAPAAGPSTYTVPAAALRVGIIDDDRLNRYVAEDFLRRLGHVPYVLDGGDDALRAVAADQLNVLLLDLTMPQESGFDIAARLRDAAGEAYAQLRIIAVTGNVLPGTVERCNAVGIDAVMQKPLRLQELGRVLHHTVRRPSEAARPAEAAGMTGDAPADQVLGRLLDDLGPQRFADACRSSQALFRSLLSGLEKGASPAWRKLLHRAQGSAGQLGFADLSGSARSLEAILEAQQGLGARITDDYSVEATKMDLAHTVHAAIDLLERRLRELGASGASQAARAKPARRGSRSREP